VLLDIGLKLLEIKRYPTRYGQISKRYLTNHLRHCLWHETERNPQFVLHTDVLHLWRGYTTDAMF